MIIDALKDFISKCPLLDDQKRVNVNYIGVEMSYSIDPLPCNPILKKYVDGGSQRQFQFQVASKELYDEDARINIENSGFYEAFSDWLESNLPYLKDKKRAIKFETLNSGYLYSVDGHDARYAIECRLIYEQEA